MKRLIALFAIAAAIGDGLQRVGKQRLMVDVAGLYELTAGAEGLAGDVVVGHDHGLGVGELPQPRPDAEHDAARVARVLLADGDHGDAVGTGFGRQVEIDDFRKLFLQKRNEQFVQGRGHHGGLVLARFAEVRGQVPRVRAAADPLDREHREIGLRVVVTGVVRERSLGRRVVRANMPLEDDLGAMRYGQAARGRLDHPAAATAQQSREGILGKGVRNRGHRGQQGGRVGADHQAGGNTFAAGGRRDRAVAVAAIDMAVWDAVAKIAGQPLWRVLADRHNPGEPLGELLVYSGGGYYYPDDEKQGLIDEMQRTRDLGYRLCKMKIGVADLETDRAALERAKSRLEADLAALAMESPAVDLTETISNEVTPT